MPAARKKKTAAKQKKTAAPTPSRAKPMAVLLLFALGALTAFGTAWILVVDQFANKQFAERQWILAGRVYATPFALYSGRPIDQAGFELELGAAGLQSGA